MADNIAVTAGSGTTVSTEEVTTLNGGAVSAQHLQRVALAVRTADGAASDIPVGSGAAGTTTPRVIHSTDDPAVVALQIVDDWDESDRAKVNLIVGQAGVAAGSGASGATTQRIILATDDPLVTRMAGSAHDAAIAGNPHRIAGRALTANYTAVATGDTADLVTTTVGALITKPYAIPEQEWSYVAASGGIDNSAAAVTIKTAAGAGLRNYITSIQIAHATLGATTEFAIRDSLAAPIWRTILHTTAMPTTTFVFPVPLKSPANSLLDMLTLTAVTGDVLVNVQGYVAP